MDQVELRKKIIWFALFANPSILFFVLKNMKYRNLPLPLDNQQISFYYLAALALFAGSFAISSFLRKKIKQTAQSLKPQQDFMISLIQWAMIEGVAMLGFAVAIRSQDISKYPGFYAMSLLGYILAFPKKNTLNLHGE